MYSSPAEDAPVDTPIDMSIEVLVDARLEQESEREHQAREQSATQAKNSAVLLADAFSEFISASSRLENSYRELQEEVAELGLELAERNAALNTSLAENERMRLALQEIVYSMPCGVLVVDGDGAISMINPESRKLLGLDPASLGEVQAATLRQISTQSGVDLESFYKNESSSDREQEFCVHGLSGKRWLEMRNRRLFRATGEKQLSCNVITSDVSSNPDQTILILRDITAQKRAEQEREAGRRAMALAEITTILAHEIRNPLASLELFAGLIEKDSRDGHDCGAWISNLRAGIRSLSGTVNNVLSFHGSGSLPLAPVSLSALIGSAIDFVKPIADQAGVPLRWLCGDGDDGEGSPMVMANENALQQVVLNLVSNAVRHTPSSGSVTVSLLTTSSGSRNQHGRRAGVQHALVEFRDTGCGIRPEQLGSVFEPGFSGSGDSSGLGLAVCERIMKQHDGRISVSSRVDSGTVFVLDFPVLQLELA